VHITVDDAQSFLEGTKARLSSLEPTLENEQSTYVLGRLAGTFDSTTTGVPTWTNETNTPELVKLIIAMFYAGWYYDRQYSEVISEERTRSYGMMLRQQAETMLEGILTGAIELVEVPGGTTVTGPAFYPTDASSTTQAKLDNTDPDNKSLGPPMFSVGMNF
jgi:hypothetical protein